MNFPIAFELINWSAPWLAPYKAIGEPIAKQVLFGKRVHVALNDAPDSNPHIHCPVRFVAQAESEGAAAYETFIWQTKTVPTRDNLHDFFNGMMWLHYPRIKAQLNALQAAAIKEQGVGQHRGKLRDALTLFDENTAFLIEPHDANATLLSAIQDKAWADAFITHRALWQDARLLLFGHALIEKLVTPRKAITAHVFCPPTIKGESAFNGNELSTIDMQMAALLSAEHLSTKPYAPLPLMGVPTWCADNEDFAFYDDAQVFRPPQSALQSAL